MLLSCVASIHFVSELSKLCRLPRRVARFRLLKQLVALSKPWNSLLKKNLWRWQANITGFNTTSICILRLVYNLLSLFFVSFFLFCFHRGRLILYEIQNIRGSPKKEKISLSGDKGSQWNCQKVTVEVSVKRQVKLRRICLNTVNWEAKKWEAQIRGKTSSLRVSRRSQGEKYWNWESRFAITHEAASVK